MGDFQKGVNIIQIDLPKPEYLKRIGLQGGKVDSSSGRTKKKMVIIFDELVPSLLDRGFADIIIRRVAIIFEVSELLYASVYSNITYCCSYPFIHSMPNIPGHVSYFGQLAHTVHT